MRLIASIQARHWYEWENGPHPPFLCSGSVSPCKFCLVRFRVPRSNFEFVLSFVFIRVSTSRCKRSKLLLQLTVVMPYTDSHRGLLQAVIARGAVSGEDARELVVKLFRKLFVASCAASTAAIDRLCTILSMSHVCSLIFRAERKHAVLHASHKRSTWTI